MQDAHAFDQQNCARPNKTVNAIKACLNGELNNQLCETYERKKMCEQRMLLIKSTV